MRNQARWFPNFGTVGSSSKFQGSSLLSLTGYHSLSGERPEPLRPHAAEMEESSKVKGGAGPRRRKKNARLKRNSQMFTNAHSCFCSNLE